MVSENWVVVRLVSVQGGEGVLMLWEGVVTFESGVSQGESVMIVVLVGGEGVVTLSLSHGETAVSLGGEPVVASAPLQVAIADEVTDECESAVAPVESHDGEEIDVTVVTDVTVVMVTVVQLLHGDTWVEQFGAELVSFRGSGVVKVSFSLGETAVVVEMLKRGLTVVDWFVSSHG